MCSVKDTKQNANLLRYIAIILTMRIWRYRYEWCTCTGDAEIHRQLQLHGKVAEFDRNCTMATLYLYTYILHSSITKTLKNINALTTRRNLAAVEHKTTHMYQLSTKQILGHVLKYTLLRWNDKTAVPEFHKIKATILLNLHALYIVLFSSWKRGKRQSSKVVKTDCCVCRKKIH